mmetsp:Transcript_5626/g.13647  ORF Transcript_5626/g.13647 Transcript_5626/m.13647 type:complete len:227 (-) Transcript_5626:117-797(-)
MTGNWFVSSCEGGDGLWESWSRLWRSQLPNLPLHLIRCDWQTSGEPVSWASVSCCFKRVCPWHRRLTPLCPIFLLMTSPSFDETHLLPRRFGLLHRHVVVAISPPQLRGEGPRRAAQMVGFGARTQVRARHFQPPPRAAHDSCREEHPDGGSLIHEVPAQNGWTAGAGGRSCGSATCRRNAAWDWGWPLFIADSASISCILCVADLGALSIPRWSPSCWPAHDGGT